MNRTSTTARRARLGLIALAALLLLLIRAHPLALPFIAALELAVLAVVARGCWRASGIGHCRRTRRWEPWTA